MRGADGDASGLPELRLLPRKRSHRNSDRVTTPSRIAIVTGGSRGIGRAISKSLAEDGAFVYVNYRSREAEAQTVVEEIQSAGGLAKAIGFDVANSEAVDQAFEAIAAENGGIDILVSNAGIVNNNLVLRTKDSDWDSVIATNLRGSFACARASLKTMLRRKNGGRLVFLSSVVGQMGNAGQTVYATTKAGLLGMTKSLAQEVASRGITVNAVAPGFVKTDMTDSLTDTQKEALLRLVPLGRWAEPQEVAAVIRFLVSPAASYITGQVISVNGGMYL